VGTLIFVKIKFTNVDRAKIMAISFNKPDSIAWIKINTSLTQFFQKPAKKFVKEPIDLSVGHY
jgi:hypothetical protein